MFARALILLLLVMNLGVAAWWWLGPEPDAPAMAIDPMVPGLRLVGEAPVAEPAPQAPVASASPACFEFGPFNDDASFARAQVAMAPIAARLSVRRDAPDGRDGRGWRVWMPPLADRAAADAMAARIVEAGLKDYYVVPNGAEANSIALGRYGNAEAAQRRQAMLRAAGFESLAEPLGSGARWLQVATRPTSTVVRLAPDIAALQRPLDCAAFAPPSDAG